MAFTNDEQSIYVLDDVGEDRVGVHKLSLDGKSYEHVYTHKSVDIAELITSTDGKSVYAARLDNGFPSYLFFSDTHEEAEVFKGLLKTFPGNRLSIRSRSSDGNLWVVQASTDVDAGSYYLFDRKANSIVQLFSSRPGVDSNELAFVEPIEFESFDGQKISGYFTEAQGREGKVSPLVVLVHKGPGNRNYWEYDSEVQALAISGIRLKAERSVVCVTGDQANVAVTIRVKIAKTIWRYLDLIFFDTSIDVQQDSHWLFILRSGHGR